MTPYIALLIASFICFALAALARKAAINTDLDLVALGGAFWVLALITGAL